MDRFLPNRSSIRGSLVNNNRQMHSASINQFLLAVWLAFSIMTPKLGVRHTRSWGVDCAEIWDQKSGGILLVAAYNGSDFVLIATASDGQKWWFLIYLFLLCFAQIVSILSKCEETPSLVRRQWNQRSATSERTILWPILIANTIYSFGHDHRDCSNRSQTNYRSPPSPPST